jgi:hypothetical protein
MPSGNDRIRVVLQGLRARFDGTGCKPSFKPSGEFLKRRKTLAIVNNSYLHYEHCLLTTTPVNNPSR